MLSASPGVNAMRHMEQCLQALAGTTMTTREKLALLAIVDDFVFGYALREAASDPKVDLKFARAQLATGAFPRPSLCSRSKSDLRVEVLRRAAGEGRLTCRITADPSSKDQPAL
jgi:Tetracyclin repressor-like, C-terminal domain